MVVRVNVIYYTGVKKGMCKEETFNLTLEAYAGKNSNFCIMREVLRKVGNVQYLSDLTQLMGDKTDVRCCE